MCSKSTRLQQVFFIAFLLSLIVPCCHAQPADEQRPKVGLVLSGGGAKGLAHIGALKVLEEAGIYPDIITGTSMGSLVGALYAIGYSAEEMEEMATQTNWGEVLGDHTSLNHIAYEEKPYYDRYIITLPIRGTKISLPQGAIEGQKLWTLFSRLTCDVHHISSFDSLGVPYANVAVDISKGEVVVQREGFLAETMRASMAIPSVFTPVSLNGRLLVDGGLIRNLPVQEALDMGADIIIAVNVGSGFLPAEKLNTLVDLLTQASFTYSNLDQEAQKQLAHLLIEPDLDHYTAASFGATADIIALGEAATRSNLQQIERLADTLHRYPVLSPPVLRSAAQKTYQLQAVSVEGNEKIARRYIQGRLRIQEGESITLDELEERIDHLYGTRYFEHIRYKLIPLAQGYHLTIIVKESPSGSLQVAQYYDTEQGVGLVVNLIQRNLIQPGSRLLLEASIAESPRFDLNYLKYIGDQQNLFLMLGVLHEEIQAAGFDEAGIVRNTYNINYLRNYLRLQTTLAKNYSFGLEAGHIYNWSVPRIGNVTQLQGISFDESWIRRITDRQFYGRAFAGINTLDRPFFPRRGWDISLSATQTLGADMLFSFQNDFYTQLSQEDALSLDQYFNNITRNQSYTIWSADLQKFVPLNSRFTLMGQAQLIVNSSESPTLTDRIYIGGILPLGQNSVNFWGLNNFEYAANAVWKASLGLQVRMWEKVYLQALTNYLEGTDETIPQESRLDGFTVWGYGLSASYLTPLGPLTFNLSKTSGKQKWLPFLSVGFNI